MYKLLIFKENLQKKTEQGARSYVNPKNAIKSLLLLGIWRCSKNGQIQISSSLKLVLYV